MEPKIIIWIIGLILYFWIRSKKATVPPNTSDFPSDTPLPPKNPKPLSFEDLLREIQASKGLPKEIKRETLEEVDNWEEEKDLEREVEEIPQTQFDRQSVERSEEVYDTYEKAKAEAFKRASLEETLSLESTDLTYTKFKEYQKSEDKPFAKELAQDFQDPERLKKAFIMGEILNRKWK